MSTRKVKTITVERKSRPMTDEERVQAAEKVLRRCAKLVEERYEAEKAAFMNDCDVNPGYAIEWKAEGLLKAQTRYEIFAPVVLGAFENGRTPREVLDALLERTERITDSFFGTSSSCPWRNAKSRVAAETARYVARGDLAYVIQLLDFSKTVEAPA